MKYSCVMLRKDPVIRPKERFDFGLFQVVMSPVGDRLVADHVEPGDDLMHHSLEELLQRSLLLLKRVELLLEKLDCLLVILLGDLRREVVMETLGITFDLDVN